MTDQLADIKGRAARATPGPWGWFGNTDTWDVYLATKRWGRWLVMDFARWGMNKATPRFAVGRSWKRSDPTGDHDFRGGVLTAVRELARFEVCPTAQSRQDPRVYRGNLHGIRHPDAEFIAHSRADIDWLVSEVERLRTLAGEPIPDATAPEPESEPAPAEPDAPTETTRPKRSQTTWKRGIITVNLPETEGVA